MTDKELSQRAKEYFAQIRKTDRLIQRLTDTVNTLRSGLTSQSYELKPDKVQTSGPKDTLGETIAKIMSLEDDINTRIDELVTMKKEAFSMISKVPDLDQQNVLVGRYTAIRYTAGGPSSCRPGAGNSQSPADTRGRTPRKSPCFLSDRPNSDR